MIDMKANAQNLGEVHESNLALIIRLLQKKKNCSRAELSELSGLKQSTITNLVNKLIAKGIVEETGFLLGKKGRRSIGIGLVPDCGYTLGIRLDRTFFTIGVFDFMGKLNEYQKINIKDKNTAADIYEEICRVAKEHLSQYKRTMAIVVSVPGPFIPKNRKIALLTGANKWTDFDLLTPLEQLSDIPVFLEHDARCGAMAEWWYEKEETENTSTYCYISAGQGIGAGFVYNGQPIYGQIGTAGEIGHMSIKYDGIPCLCGNIGCLERYCSEDAILESVKQKLENYPNSILTAQSTPQEILNAAKEGDELADMVLSEVSFFLGIGIVNIVNGYNPGEIIIGDLLSGLSEKYLEIIRQTVQERIIPEVYESVNIRLSRLKKDPAFMGTAPFAYQQILSQPSKFFDDLTTDFEVYK